MSHQPKIRMKLRPLFVIAIGVATLTALSLPMATSAAIPEELIQFPADGALGSDAGRLDNPRGMAVDPATGHLYVADSRNARVSEFTAWGLFVKAFGWGVADGLSNELQTCGLEEGFVTPNCLKGIRGPGAGQLSSSPGLVVDPEGHVYVFDKNLPLQEGEGGENSLRVQKFDSDGGFLLMFGGEVNKTTGADVCTQADVAGGDECGVGIVGSGDSEFSTSSVGNYLALSPDGQTIYVGDKERIQEFNPDGSFKGILSDPDGVLIGETVHSLATDPASGDLYVTLVAEEDVRKLSATTGKAIGSLPVKAPLALTADSEGNLYVVNDLPGSSIPQLDPRVLKFDPSGACLVCGEEGEDGEDGFDIAKDGTGLIGLATSSACEAGSDTLYVSHFRSGTLSYVRAFGPPPQDVVKCPPPPPEPPQIDSQYARSVGTDWASMGAEINPNFALDATYYLEYGAAPCTAGGCASYPAPPGQGLTAKVSKKPLTAKPIVLSGLAPDTTYHYRFVAVSAGSEGQPVKGVDGEVGTDGAEGTFTTFPLPPPPKSDCPNQSLRAGPSAFLPDCRAYEIVSPIDKNGTDIQTSVTIIGHPARLDQAAVDGERFTYSSEQAFADAVSAPKSNQYLAIRTGQGWANHAIAAPRESVPISDSANTKFDIEFKAFSPDLCSGWLVHNTAQLLAPDAAPGYLNLYRRTNCDPGADSYAALSTTPPAASTPQSYNFELQGISADGSHAVFAANGKLAVDSGPEASDSTLGDGSPIFQLYESHPGGLRLVSVLPGGEASEVTSMTGTGSDFGEGRSGSVVGAVSEDASHIYWSSEGALYLRTDGEETAQVSPAPSQFWAASPNGSRAVYTRSDALFRYDANADKSTLIATDVQGVAATSADATRAYFVSSEALAEGAMEGEPNLFLAQQGQPLAFVATLASSDLSPAFFRDPLSVTAPKPLARGTRTTPSGSHLAFMSAAPLTGYDNRDAQSGQPDMEIFLYDAEAESLVCVSCNPSGARPSGRSFGGISGAIAWAAAILPAWQNQLHAPKVISEDGDRVFFEGFEALVPRDTNGVTDVYQWQRGDAKACEKAGTELHVPSSGGCLSLISSGKGQLDAEFVDATPDGSDVFFKTAASLVPHDPGLIDIYDARVAGGLPHPAQAPAACEGEACVPATAAPNDLTPASTTFRGAGNLARRAASCAAPTRRAKRLHKQADRLRSRARRAKVPARARAMRGQAGRIARRASRLAAQAKRCRAVRRRANANRRTRR